MAVVLAPMQVRTPAGSARTPFTTSSFSSHTEMILSHNFDAEFALLVAPSINDKPMEYSDTPKL